MINDSCMIGDLRTTTPIGVMQFHFSLFTFHSSLFTLHSSLFTLHFSLFTQNVFSSPDERNAEHPYHDDNFTGGFSEKHNVSGCVLSRGIGKKPPRRMMAVRIK